MAIVFPASPSTNDTFTAGSITYKWDGDKWIGLGVTPADRLVEGSNSLEIQSNTLNWSGGNTFKFDYNDTGLSQILKGFDTSHNTANRGATFRIGFSDGSFGGIEFENVEGSNAAYNSQSTHIIRHDGGVVGDVKALSVLYNGNVGINETEPEQALHITVANAAVQLENPGGTRWRFANESNVLKVIQSGVAEHILLDTSGNLTQYGGSQTLRSSNTSGRGKKTSVVYDNGLANGANNDFLVPGNGHAGGTVTVTLLLSGNASVKTTTQWPVMWNTNSVSMGIGGSLWSTNGSGGGRSFSISGVAGGIRVANNSGGTCDVTVVFELYGSA